MLIKIFKQRTLQISQFEPITFSYGLENDVPICPTNSDLPSLKECKEDMEKTIDDWLEVETTKWQKYKQKSSSNAVPSIKERSPF